MFHVPPHKSADAGSVSPGLDLFIPGGVYVLVDGRWELTGMLVIDNELRALRLRENEQAINAVINGY